jgi:hypothetical protein
LERRRKKKWILLGLASLVLAVSARPLMFWAYLKFFYEPTLASYPPAMRPWIDPKWFQATIYWRITKAIWASLGILWASLIGYKILTLKNRKRVVAAVALVLVLSPLLIWCTLKTAKADYTESDWNYVDVLIVADEECRAREGDGRSSGSVTSPSPFLF